MHTYWIDIVGTCNLRCPTCPTGNFRQGDFSGDVKPLGFMAADKFAAILAKINADQSKGLTRVELYNWGEPLLHPNAPAMIAAVKSYPNFRCGISSNLSLPKLDLRAVLVAKPDWFRVSLSGFSQPVYGQTHKRGDIELVKRNMALLRSLIDETRSEVTVEVAYHVYRHNGGELAAMADYCKQLGFKLCPVWAQFYPIEKLLHGRYSDADKQTIDTLVHRPERLLELAQPYRHEPCRLQDGQTAINYDGSVQLCCASFEPTNIIAKDFASSSPSELTDIKHRHTTCDKCIAGGYHAMMAYRGLDQPSFPQ